MHGVYTNLTLLAQQPLVLSQAAPDALGSRLHLGPFHHAQLQLLAFLQSG